MGEFPSVTQLESRDQNSGIEHKFYHVTPSTTQYCLPGTRQFWGPRQALVLP